MVASPFKQVQILKSIIVDNPIKVVNYLPFLEVSAKGFFSHKDMLSYIVRSSAIWVGWRVNFNVAIHSASTALPIHSVFTFFAKKPLSSVRGFASYAKRISTGFRAKLIFASSVFLVSRKRLVAKVANISLLIESSQMFVFSFVRTLFRAKNILILINNILKGCKGFIASVAIRLNNLGFLKSEIARLRTVFPPTVFKFPKRSVELFIAPLAGTVFTSFNHKYI